LILRIGGGALGGKGEGLALIDELLRAGPAGSPVRGAQSGSALGDAVPGLPISMPRTAIVCTEAFEEFERAGGLGEYAAGEGDYAALRARFLATPLPEAIAAALGEFMDDCGRPLIARSSSLLEDSTGEPFSGVYESYAIPNDHPDFSVRLGQLLDAVRLVYASLHSPDARAYRAASPCCDVPGCAAEESMAVVVQELVGGRRGRWFYPALSGTAQSYNYYPLSYARPEDGLCVAALGLGSYVVEGGAAHRFCPKYPALNATSPELAGQGAQMSFRALDMETQVPDLSLGEFAALAELDIAEAEGSDALGLAASTWDGDDGRLVPGAFSPGPRVLDFAPLLKYEALPFAAAIGAALGSGELATGGPVELEYALDRDGPGGEETLFLLQLKRLARSGPSEIDLEDLDAEGCLVASERSMGEGRIEGIRDIVIVEPGRFDRSKSREVALEVAALDRELAAQGRHYLLIGPGRWGSRDPGLGVPVTYPQIARAAVIVETEMPGFAVDFSFGSHFLRNVAGRGIGYMAVSARGKGGIDWDRISSLRRERETAHCSLCRLDGELEVLMDGRRGRALVRLN
jgi:hypothetical protein